MVITDPTAEEAAISIRRIYLKGLLRANTANGVDEQHPLMVSMRKEAARLRRVLIRAHLIGGN